MTESDDWARYLQSEVRRLHNALDACQKILRDGEYNEGNGCLLLREEHWDSIDSIIDEALGEVNDG